MTSSFTTSAQHVICAQVKKEILWWEETGFSVIHNNNMGKLHLSEEALVLVDFSSVCQESDWASKKQSQNQNCLWNTQTS